jgi:hypothetical protein
MDWAWTKADFYPWLYFHKLEDWRYYEKNLGFYDAQTESWELREILSEQLSQIEPRPEENSIGEESSSTYEPKEETDSNQTQLIYYFLTISSGQGGSASGEGNYFEGTNPVISSTPDKGHEFLHWTGDGVADAHASTTTVTMDQDGNLNANFVIQQKVLYLNAGLGGSVTGANTYDYGSEANISALADMGYQFLNWTGGGVTDANASTTTVTMNQDRNLTAKFRNTSITTDQDQNITGSFPILQKVLSLNAGPGGTVTGANTYDYGNEANISALADTGYQFLNWTGDGIADVNASTSTVTMDQDRNLTASFVILQKVLSLNAGPGGTVTGANTYDYGSEANISAAANTSYQFLNWTGDGVTGANASTTTVTMDQDRNLTANFSLLQPILTLTSESGGSVSGGGTYSYGEMVTIVATPDSGFRFLDWNGSRVANSSSATTTITLIADSNLTATFEAIPASLAGMVDPHEMVRRMGRGINLGNVLSAPEEGRWAPAATERYFMDLADANFANVRIPMDFYGDRTSGDTSSYSTLANTSTDFTGSMDDFVVSNTYLDRIEEVVTWSLNQGLITVLDFHGSDLKT